MTGEGARAALRAWILTVADGVDDDTLVNRFLVPRSETRGFPRRAARVLGPSPQTKA